MIFVIEDDWGWVDYYERMLKGFEVEFFRNGIVAMERMENIVPDLVILDVLLTGPTGFAVLNEMQSYEDLAKVPVLLVSSVDITESLSEYGVKKIFNKGEMKPGEVVEAVRQWIP